MGFFDKIFAKKICDICGGEIGLLGNRKLEDGNCCKNCAKKLSPFFDERRHSTVEQIKDQIAYREKNAKELEDFSADVVLGELYKMYVEMKDGVPYRFVVSTSDDFRTENADIIFFKNVASCELKIRDSRTEQKYTNDKNERVSYNPPRYEYHYDFYIYLGIVNTPYFDDINLRINRSTLDLETVSSGSIFIKEFDPMLYPEYRQFKAMCDSICEYVSCGQNGIACNTANNNANVNDTDFMDRIVEAESDEVREQMLRAEAAKTTDSAKKQEYLNMAQFYAGNTAVGSAEAPAIEEKEEVAPEGWSCPSCGNENSGKFCQGCGTPKPVAPIASDNGWKCFCGTVNTGKFCQNCGTEKFAPEDIECSECSWTADTWHENVGVPSECPNCGKKFNADDIC